MTDRFEELEKLPGLILARHFGRSAADEDLLQEGKLELWRCIRERDKVHTSLFNYAYTCILNRYTHMMKRKQTAELERVDEVPAEEIELEERISLAEAAGRALRKWPRQAQAVQLKAMGLSYRQIGAEMGVSHTTARRLCRRAAEHLRERGAI